MHARCSARGHLLRVASLALLGLLSASTVHTGTCNSGSAGGGPTPSPTIPYPLLSQYALFTGNGSTQEPAADVLPYDVISTLFADFSHKRRFLRVPAGGTIGYEAEKPWRFPEGTIVVKTFSYFDDFRNPALGEQLLETRLLIKTASDWTVHTYVWNAEQTEAVRKVAGAKVNASWIDEAGTAHALEYRVPNSNQCLGCHGEAGRTDLLGPRTRQMNREYDYSSGPENQIDHLAALGLFDVAPPPFADRQTLADPLGSGPLDARARSYLDANCAHCHNPDQSLATSSGLFLGIETTDPSALGVCRSPVAAGNGTGGFSYDVVPGDPDASIMVYRMASTDPEIKMPEMPTQLSDPDGVALISAWIASLTPAGCP